MKRLVSILLVLAMVAGLASGLGASAASEGVLEYMLSGAFGNEATITDCANTATDEQVASAIRAIENAGNKIVSIDSSAFYDCIRLTSIAIPNTVTSIGIGAFSNCINLETVSLSNNLKNIWWGAFLNCKSLKSIDIPDSVTNIMYADDSGSNHYGVFLGCTSLASVKIGTGLQKIPGYCFEGCTSLTSIVLSDWIKDIDVAAFQGCTKLENVTFGESITTIGDSAFWGCEKLTRIDLPESVKKIDESAFGYCTGIKTINLNYGLEEIGADAFGHCTSLTSIVIPDSVRAFGYVYGYVGGYNGTIVHYGVFRDCTSLKYVTLGIGLRNLNTYAFVGCTALKGILLAREDMTFENSALSPQATIYCYKRYSIAINYAKDKKLRYVLLDWRYGDSEPNGFISAASALLVIKHAAKKQTLDQFDLPAADVNRDGSVNVTDALLILKAAVGKR